MLGAYPSQAIKRLVKEGEIIGAKEESLQPSSLDLSISDEIYKMKGIFLPRKNEKIADIIKEGALFKTDLDKPLECEGVYMIKLKESLNFSNQIFALTNNKSSSGRINLQVRLLADGVSKFDKVPRGYKGDLWILVNPKSFAVKLVPGNALNQMMFFDINARLSEKEHRALYEKYNLFYNKHGEPILYQEVEFDSGGGLTMTVDLDQDIVGYKCIPQAEKMLDFNKYFHDPLDFFEPIIKPKNGIVVLKKDHFYILSTKEFVRVPCEYAMEMIAYDTSKGEYRSHYAGFIDPGWGYGEKGEIKGTPLVLEVFTNDNDFILRDEQPICKVVYESLVENPELIYGVGNLGSHYHTQRGPRLSKHFKT
ncbi:MAG: 2'-deoxycytidine 5'-triphosphate deaminase [Candidatus Margulisiibacteriota bacterium]|jgi:dCTP deaminase